MTTDLHLNTVEKDPVFDAFMQKMWGERWRMEMSPREQRMAAKSYNFARLYGSGKELKLEDIERIDLSSLTVHFKRP